MYKKFPTIDYPYLGNKKKLAVDILKRFRLTDVAAKETPFWEEYIVQDEDTPETLAHILYKDPSLHWLILLVNGVIDPNQDWLMSENKYKNYISRMYSGPAIFLDIDSLNHKDGDLDKGKTVICETPTGNRYEAQILEWNRTFFRLHLTGDEADSFIVDATLLNENEEEIATIGRKVDYGYEAVHRFEDSTGNILDPLDYIESYIAGEALESINVITIDAFEKEINESKRSIVVVRPEFVNKIVYKMEREIAKIKNLQAKSGYVTRTKSKRPY